MFDLRATCQVLSLQDDVTGSSPKTHRTIVADLYEYASTGGTTTVRYTVDPAQRKLIRQVIDRTTATSSTPTVLQSRVVLAGIDDGWFICYNRNGAAVNPTTSADKVTAIRFVFVPSGRSNLVVGSNNPSCSALIQLRNRE